MAVRTAYIELEARPGDNHVPGTVRQRLFHGDFVQYVIDSAVGPMIVRRPPINLMDEGAAVTLSFSPEHCVLLEACHCRERATAGGDNLRAETLAVRKLMALLPAGGITCAPIR